MGFVGKETCKLTFFMIVIGVFIFGLLGVFWKPFTIFFIITIETSSPVGLSGFPFSFTFSTLVHDGGT